MTLKYLETELNEIHNSSAMSDDVILKSKLFGCFYCCKTFPPNEVRGYITGPERKWAHCPYCGTDAVISDNGTGEIDSQLLLEMSVHYFDRPVDKSDLPEQ